MNKQNEIKSTTTNVPEKYEYKNDMNNKYLS